MWLWIFGVAAFVIFIGVLVNSGYVGADLSIDTETESFGTVWGSGFGWVDFILGGVPKWLNDKVKPTSAAIITLAIFLLLFITFGDIIANFSTFSKNVAWISGFLIAVVAANLKAIVVILGFFIGIFAFLGGLAVLVGLVASFVAFFAVNWGIGSFGPWILRRKAMMEAAKESIKTEAGAKQLAAKIRGLHEAGEALKWK